MRLKLSAPGVRLFLCTWILFSAHFATDMVREHFPAFSLVEDGSFRVDRYVDFHPDIFVHTDGHAYIGNNVAASVVAAVPLWVFDPALDALERQERKRLADAGPPDSEYRVADHPNSQKFFRLAKEAGLTLRFGASAAVTSVFLMALLSAGVTVLMAKILRARGVPGPRADGLAWLFAFGTPVFFRTGVLNHNMMALYATFVAFHLIWVRSPAGGVAPWVNRFTAGALAGIGLALDYSGVVGLLCLYGYLVFRRLGQVSFWTSCRESIPFILGSVPPVGFLLYSQWSMFGNPWMPGQYWMPDVSESQVYGTFENPYSTDGFRGFTWPAPDLAWMNLWDPAFGLFTYGPLLLVGLWPVLRKRGPDVFATAERRFGWAFALAFLTFCSANQYSRIQSNSGFRYMIPIVPFLFLMACNHLARLRGLWLWVLAIPCVINSWVIAMVREPVPESWERVLTEGPQLKWLTVLRLTASPDHPILGQGWLAPVIIAATLGFVFWLWRWTGHREVASSSSS